MDPIYCMIYPNTLKPVASIFEGVTDDDAKFASLSSLISDDAIQPTEAPTGAPIYQPGSPTKKPAVAPTSLDYILAFGVTFSPLDISDIHKSCDDFFYGKTSTSCSEFSYLSTAITRLLGSTYAASAVMSEFGVFDMEEIDIYSRRLSSGGWTSQTTNKPVLAPTQRPFTVTKGVTFGVYFTYKFSLTDSILDTVDSILSTMYSNMVSVTLPETSSKLKDAKIQPDYFSYLGYFDPKYATGKATDDYLTEPYSYYHSIYSYSFDDYNTFTYSSEDSGGDGGEDSSGDGGSGDSGSGDSSSGDSSSGSSENTGTRKLFRGQLATPSPELKAKFDKFKLSKRGSYDSAIDSDYKEVEVDERKLDSTSKDKVDKKTGASCYILASDTFMYQVIKDFGVGGTSAPPADFNYSNFLLKKDKQLNRLDGSLFSKFPLECIVSNVRSSSSSTRKQYSDCQKFHANLGFIFYPGVSSTPGSTLKTVTNGKIFDFGKDAFNAMVADSTSGDISTTNKAYNALSAFPYSSRYYSNDVYLFPRLNTSIWNSAFQTLCTGMCSMLGNTNSTITKTITNTYTTSC